MRATSTFSVREGIKQICGPYSYKLFSDEEEIEQEIYLSQDFMVFKPIEETGTKEIRVEACFFE